MDKENLNNWKIKILKEAIIKAEKAIIEEPDLAGFLRGKKKILEDLLNNYNYERNT